MNEGDMLSIRVPASTANLGPGYDSIGLAVNLYLELCVERAGKWSIESATAGLAELPKDESNFIIKTALETAKKYNKTLFPCKITVKSDIPLARGLGSSAAAIIAGIEIANSIGELHLSQEEKFQIASLMEGHPDNVGPCLFGGLVIGTQQDEDVDAVVFHDLDIDLVACVPKEELLTKESRSVLPQEWPFSKAVTAGSIGNVLVAALLTRDYQLAGKMMKNDLYHQPYRRKLIPRFTKIEEIALEAGAFGVALSGAGPTVMCYCEKGKGAIVKKNLEERMPNITYYSLQIDSLGSQVEMNNCVIY